MIVYQSSPVLKEGNTTKTIVQNIENEFLLKQILIELKKSNIHLSVVSNEELINGDIE